MKYLLSSYLRTRLWKVCLYRLAQDSCENDNTCPQIERHVQKILDDEELAKRLSADELTHATQFARRRRMMSIELTAFKIQDAVRGPLESIVSVSISTFVACSCIIAHVLMHSSFAEALQAIQKGGRTHLRKLRNSLGSLQRRLMLRPWWCVACLPTPSSCSSTAACLNKPHDWLAFLSFVASTRVPLSTPPSTLP